MPSTDQKTPWSVVLTTVAVKEMVVPGVSEVERGSTLTRTGWGGMAGKDEPRLPATTKASPDRETRRNRFFATTG
jgi:hypothetical protein